LHIVLAKAIRPSFYMSSASVADDRLESDLLMGSLYANLDRLRPYVLSILRIMAALLFMQHALAKDIGFPIAGPPLRGLFIPAAIIETIGGSLLLVGAYTRIAAFILSGEMAVAYFLFRPAKSFYPIANGGEVEILFCFVFLYLVFAGAGPWSVDRAALGKG
jgi:putative oxidoreductase